MKTRLLLILIFVATVLACSSSLIDAQAEDTYNFYFQKAPGPTVVNQGVAGPTNPKDVIVNPDSTPVAGAPLATKPAVPETVGQAMTAENSSSFRWLEISLGGAGISDPGADAGEGNYGKPQTNGGALGGVGQYALGLQWNWSENFAIQAEAFYMNRRPKTNINGTMVESKGQLWDYGANLVITPFRLNAGTNMKLVMSGLLGGMSAPFHRHGTAGPQIAHSGTFTYGGRLGFEVWNRVTLQGTVRKLARFGGTHGTASLGFLF